MAFDAFSTQQTKGVLVKLIEVIEAKNEALRVSDIARILGVSGQQIYKWRRRDRYHPSELPMRSVSTHNYSRRGSGRNILLSMSCPFREL